MPRNVDMPTEYSPDWLEALDGRTRISRLVNERYQALLDDIGPDLSYQKQSLAKRAIWLEASIEKQEAAMARGEAVESGVLTQQINSLMGVLKALGLERGKRDVPSLHDFIAKRGDK